jgi:hypothetical protein
VQDVQLRRSFLNQLTGDGTLVLAVLHETEPILVTGIARGERLDEIFQQLLNLVFTLRSSKTVQGIIT